MADDQSTSGSGNPIDLRGLGNNSGTGGNPQPTGQTGDAGKFDIPEAVKKQYPDLIPLILETESMTDEERQYWFQILPIMTNEQVTKLREILINEKEQLKKLDQEYEQELGRINQKHSLEWKEFATKEKREKLKTAESKAEKEESETEEELYKKIQEL